MTDSEEEPVFSAGDIRQVTGLSSRQLNDWDERGALPHVRKGTAGWRRFTLRETFVLMVCAEMRKRFGVPIDRLKVINGWMLQEEADHLGAAVELIATLGVDVWIVTDFDQAFLMGSDLELRDFFGAGIAGTGVDGYAVLKVNPMVNRLLGALDREGGLPRHGAGYQILADWQEQTHVRSPVEQQVLHLIRQGSYDSILITLKDGAVERIKKSKRLDPTSRIGELIGSNDYQQIRVNVQDGEVIFLEQAVTEKP